MKPNFALSLSVEGIRLLHREADGWVRLGEVPLDSPDLAGDLARLRARALRISPAGIDSKLIIPSDQIRYLTLEGELGPEAVAAALEGATPYPVADLVYDHVFEDGRTHVAAVARETLQEAELFASDHQMGPVGFAALPDDGEFPTEPVFGTATGVATPLERDPVRELEPAPEAEPASPDTAPEVEASSPAPAPEPETASPVTLVAEREVETLAQGAAPEEMAAEEADVPATAEPEDPAPDVAQNTDAPDAPHDELEAEQSLPQAPVTAPDAAPVPEEPATPAMEEPAAPAPDKADMAATQDTDDDLLAPEHAPAASARPQTEDAAPDDATATEPAEPAEPATGPARPAPPPPTAPLPPGRREEAPRADPAEEPGPRIMPPAVPRPGAPPAAMPPVPSATDTPADPEQAEAAALAAAESLRPAEPAAEGDAAIRRSPRAAAAEARARERERMTVFGARESRSRSGPHWLYIALALILLAALTMGAVWLGSAAREPVANLLRGGSAQELQMPVAARPNPADDASAPAAPTEAEEPAAAAPAPAVDYTDYPEPEPASGRAISPAEADRVYAATGVWLRAPRLPLVPRSEELAIAHPDPAAAAPRQPEGLRLAAAAPEIAPAPQPVPPGPGTRYERDARGFIAATPDGTLTPQGLVVYAGAPALIPPARPGAEIQPAVAATSAQTGPPQTGDEAGDDPAAPAQEAELLPVQAPAVTVIEGPPPVNPPNRPGSAAPGPRPGAQAGIMPGGVALDGLRPSQRPDEETVAEAAPLPAFAGPRPPGRPENLAPMTARLSRDPQSEALAEAVAEATPPVRATSVADALASIMRDAPDPLANATPQAVAQTPRPGTRPRNFDRVVAQQLRRSPPSPQGQAAAPREVANAAVAPTGPVPGNVARTATSPNAINLNDINLIGVYGRPGDRRALVRLANGRYLRVGIGDSLDGGRVTAIGGDVLNYVKRGRTQVLKIPD
ncbi:hypothetical protein [Limimaricola pyoseonensis]|uniref:Type IV pilus biogenesis protein PilP n=1 Tax=Limimaricola pyoseonensis TaxID=521013 RepID=A0A1G7CZC7_9RHOB|nr:hypothetical protein [Limimaricola pyoseonensis]SDE44026.1 hypothetical protein SAMN04488567_1686 [Limimaricola pyoseonensis]